MGKPARLNVETGKAENAVGSMIQVEVRRGETFDQAVRRTLANDTHQRVWGNGLTAKTPIEGAARAGYLDALANRPFSAEWERAEPQWQRNYEAGRQWAVAIRTIGLEPADWPEGARVPGPLLEQLGTVRAVTGSGTRPEDTPAPERPRPNNDPLHAVVPRVVRGRIVERTAA